MQQDTKLIFNIQADYDFTRWEMKKQQLYDCSKHSVCTMSIDENAVERSIDL